MAIVSVTNKTETWFILKKILNLQPENKGVQ